MERSLTVDREIDACSEFLKQMSPQWQTAKHCHMALSLMSAKIKQMERHPNGPNPHAYTMRHPGETYSMDPIEMRRQDLMNDQNDGPQGRFHPIAEEPQRQADASLEDSHLHDSRPGLDAAPLGPFQSNNFNGESLLADNATQSSELNFQNVDSGQFAGSSFDLNMIDLLQGADFNSLFDIVGQQYPSF